MQLSTLLPFLLTTTSLIAANSLPKPPSTSIGTTSTVPPLGNTLNVTVVTAHNGRSVIECWALEPDFETSTVTGTDGASFLSLGPIGGVEGGNTSYVVVPPGFDGGRHNSPVNQWVFCLSGELRITLPNSTSSARISAGKNSAILALDTPDVSELGHYTDYPSKERSIGLEIPLGAAGVPKHRVLSQGACAGEQLLD
ncbi:hypothetical protein N7474_007275 [Penicillium riverlandense]|uniref:uncharacterized protein n=1 Tax=Penicillium riverlandense TaxID=1903569 RepID=UPI00254946CA|nr:uncharacterized protein N7474_007275 [Penicillium riverlandense]KAJ5815498.1 hypothetical protein N7474_007275 [Penicillium riverlandense]